jgi:exosortase A-associated hydrolase 1
VSAPSERCVVFDCAGAACVGMLHAASAPVADAGVLIVVGGPQYRVGSHRQFVLLARDLAASGYPVFRFDYRGMGDSEGDARDFRFVAEDLVAAIDTFARTEPGVSKVVVFGLCDAASAALMHVTRDPRVAGLILANPWVRTEAGLARAHVQHYYRGRVFQKTFWKKMLSGRFDVRRAVGSFLRNLSKAKSSQAQPAGAGDVDFVAGMLRGLGAFRQPTLVVLSGRDLTAREFEDQCGRDPDWSKELSRPWVVRCDLPQADHTFSGRTDAAELGRVCTDWLGKVLGRKHLRDVRSQNGPNRLDDDRTGR